MIRDIEEIKKHALASEKRRDSMILLAIEKLVQGIRSPDILAQVQRVVDARKEEISS